ncbi:PspC domain-containing protein [Bifidobacterium sp.]|jgi:phage shock protein PspC (stress-responsive transcriptional regulator)|uniref:PspC domain-containing protein n=1 Tax=Bifidobacterium sp. TaxID=41200 RepID=UPI0025C52D67|nr:PspC domain-containing protein [Bifidobacterium sp.]MCH4209578.1 PspC domain-containing protein [Bifidobacterium sp.]MCI1225023.1 PspC domain-containing protein [Bifidobacterium sp.]
MSNSDNAAQPHDQHADYAQSRQNQWNRQHTSDERGDAYGFHGGQQNGQHGSGNPGGPAGGPYSGQGGQYGQYGHYGPEPHPYGQSAANHPRHFFRWIRESRIMRGEDRWIGGVCAGLANRAGWSPVLVRALMLASIAAFGFGLALYAAAWLLLPDEQDGHIIVEDLINGQWRWPMLGPLIMFVIVFFFRGYGLVVNALATALLLALINNLAHRETMAARASDWTGPASGSGSQGDAPSGPEPQPGPETPPSSGQPGSRARQQPWSGPNPANGTSAPAGFAYDPEPGPVPGSATHLSGSYSQTGTAGSRHHNQHDRGTANASPTNYAAASTARQSTATPSAAGSRNGRVDGRPAGPAAGRAPGPAPFSATATYRRSVTPPAPRYARRKPAGFGMVAVVLGVIFVSAAVLLGIRLNADLYLADIVKMAVLWCAGVCLLLGLAILVLGLMGRRAGGLIPVALLAGLVTVCVAVFGGFYTYNLNNMRIVDASYTTASGRNPRSFGSGERDMAILKNGVAFVGDDYDRSHASIDLRDYAQGRKHHNLTLASGKTVTSQCPVGMINLTAYRTQVSITLPDGCSYSFGNGNKGYYSSVYSIGNRYAAVNRLSTSASLFEFMQYATDEDDSNYAWLFDDAKRPANGPELWINATSVIEGKVSVRYASEPKSGVNGAASRSAGQRGSLTRAIASLVAGANGDVRVHGDAEHATEERSQTSISQLAAADAPQFASAKENSHE